MKRRLFKRKPKENPLDRWETIATNLVQDLHRYPILHKVSYEPRPPQPRPVRMWFEFNDYHGRRYVGLPQPIFGQGIMMYPFPLSWLTGRDEDHKEITVNVHLEY